MEYIGGKQLENDNNNKNIKLFLLDPLSVIVKLAILGNKPIGTKINIQDNVIGFNEPGIFQSLCRYMYKTNKTDLQYLYNPIQLACLTFLSKDALIKTPRMKQLFICAQKGLLNLMETYKPCSIIRLCLNYYYTIITNYVDQIYNETIFHKDTLTAMYSEELVKTLNRQWTPEKIKLILDIVSFLSNDNMASNNVKSLENLMENIDKDTHKYIDG